MNYLSVCSGIEAASVAWHPLGWRPVAFSEIEPFASAVLACRWPGVTNLGDMTKYETWSLDSIDILVGGTPCQSFSVSGLRAGLNDDRGNLCLTFCEIADRFDPEIILWENVPGVLSDKTNAFGCLLGRLCGANDALAPNSGSRWTSAGVVSGPSRTVAWRVLDAQYFRLAQRRRRVFVLAFRGAGNWRAAAALFPVGEGLRGDPASSRKAAKGIAGTIDASASRSRGAGSNPGMLVAGSLTKAMGRRGGVPDNGDTPGQLIVSHNPACTLTRREYKGPLPEADLSTVIAFRHFTGPTDTGAPQVDIVPTLRKSDTSGQCVAFSGRCRGDDGRGYDRPPNVTGDIAGTIDAVKPGNVAGPTIGVRRLTPRECERLQGFPDDYTRIPNRLMDALKIEADPDNKKHWAKDGPRYAALGNSMAVPVMNWIGRRIEFVKANF